MNSNDFLLLDHLTQKLYKSFVNNLIRCKNAFKISLLNLSIIAIKIASKKSWPGRIQTAALLH